jgi:hypothetical protein
MKLITHPLDDGSGASAAVCVCTYDERSVPAGAGFIWNQIVPKAWATTSAKVAARLWMHADETTIQRLLKAGVISMDQRDQRLRELATAAPASKRDRAEELAVRLATRPALIDAIHFLLNYLAARCDGAVTEDGKGFNGTDTQFGHELAARPSLSPKQAAYAQIMLWKYMGQIGHLPQFNEVYGAEAEAERVRLAAVEAEKLQARMAGKVCKAHQRQITFLAKGKRVGFCDECKPVAVNCANCQQPLAETDHQLLCPACRGAEADALPTPAERGEVAALGAADGVAITFTDGHAEDVALEAFTGVKAVCEFCLEAPPTHMVQDEMNCWRQACDVCDPRETQPGCPLCGNPIIDTRATCNHASAMNADQRASEKANGRAVCTGCDQYIISGLHRCMGKPKAVQQHPVDAAVALMREAGLGDLIDPAKVEVIRQHVDAPVAEEAARWITDGQPGVEAGADGSVTWKGAGVAVEGRQSAPEASAALSVPSKPASALQREVAGLSVALDTATDRQWDDLQARHSALKLLASARQRDDLITDAMLDDALTKALVIAGKVAKAEAKAGNIIKAARR